jgi:biotin carboxylase
MKIRFDAAASIAGIGLVPWTRLGPERWFKNYKITGLYGWDLGSTAGVPEVIALSDQPHPMPRLERLNTPHLLETKEFQQLVLSNFPGYSFLTYKPVAPPQALLVAGCQFLSMNQALTSTLENKVEFRTKFADLNLPFPAYDIYERAELKADSTTIARILQGRKQVILQDEILGGGRGTFRVHDVDSLRAALAAIEHLGGHKRVVVSEMIEDASERSVQAVLTKQGVFVGPLQKQIVSHPLLSNLRVPDGDRFCGAEISAQDPLLHVYPELRGYALAIGARLQELGYKGIFGIDALIGRDGRMCVLEVNPRLTGVTPLLTMLYREGKDIPFYLLHILELGGFDYEITDTYIDPIPPEGGLLVLHSQEDHQSFIAQSPASGLYDLATVAYKNKQYRLGKISDSRDLLLQRYTPEGFHVRPGGRLMTAYVNGRILDEYDELLPDVEKAVTSVIRQVKLQKAEEDD